MIVEQDGARYEFVGYAPANQGDWFLDHSSRTIYQWALRVPSVERALFRRVPVEHTFGGVVFEETGEVRMAKEGEWTLSAVGLQYWNVDSLCKYKILRAVRCTS
jgi:hypothetical protein